jgi:hypothetical protein
MLESTLQKLIPEKLNTFAKLQRGSPYYFDRWENHDRGAPCLYYWFMARDGVKKNKKRIPVIEIRAALHELRSSGLLTRGTFSTGCPVAKGDGSCSLAVVGRIFEALHVAEYSGRGGFKLTNANDVNKLLEATPRVASRQSR